MKKILIVLIVITHGLLVNAQKLTIDVNTPIVVSMGELFKISYKTNQINGSVKLYPSNDFNIKTEASVSRGKQISIKNGKKDTIYFKTYEYALEPIKPGKYIIPKFSLTIDSQSYFADVKEITVIEKTSNENSNDEIFLDVTLSKTNVYVQEAFTSTIKLYTQREIKKITNLILPTFDDFLVFDLEHDHNFTTDTINGKLYNTQILQQVELYPTLSGEFDFDNISLSCEVNTGIKKDKEAAFNLFFDRTNSTKIELQKKFPTIKVEKLPETCPDNFSGITSDQILLKANLSNSVGKKGASFFYDITLTGNGNLKLFPIPKIDLPKQLKIVKSHILKEQLPSFEVGNTITYQYEITPLKKGKFKIPPFSMSYFDLNTKEFKTLTTTKKLIKVLDCDNIQNK